MSFIEELKRRNVVRVGVAYVVAAWLILQVSDIVLDNIAAPEWLMQGIMFVLAIGLPIALIFAWAFELTPEGIKKERDVDRSQSITQTTGRKLDFTIIAVLAIALCWFAYDKFIGSEPINVGGSHAADQSTHREHGSLPQDQMSIAVLPFVDMSPAKDNEYFTDGLTEELLNILAQIKSLQVAGRTSSFAFKGKTEDLREIGEKLNVNTLLEGSVRKDDKSQKIRVTVQLINVEDGYHIWSDTYDRDLEDIFAIQEDIARKVADALKVNLLGEEEERIAAHTETGARAGMNAYDLYLQGLQDLNLYTFDSLRNAEKLFDQSLSLDANYMPTKLALVRTMLNLSRTGAISLTEGIAKARPLLNDILKTEPDNSDALVYRGIIEETDGEYVTARQSYEKALALNPRHALALREYGSLLMQTGSSVEGLEHLKQAVSIEPYDTQILWELCASYSFLIDEAGSERECNRIGEIEPGNPMQYYGRAFYYQFSGDLANSILWNVKAFELDPNDHELPSSIASDWIDLGDMKQAEAWLLKAENLAPDQPYTIKARTALLLQNEQYQQAVDLAQRVFDQGLSFRQGASNSIVGILVDDAVKQRDYDQAMSLLRTKLPVGMHSPLELDHPRGAVLLAEMAKVENLRSPGSENAAAWLKHAEFLVSQMDDQWIPFLKSYRLAMIAAARGDRQAASSQLEVAFEKGWRTDWQETMRFDFLFADFHDEPDFKNLLAMFEADMEQQREDAYELLGFTR